MTPTLIQEHYIIFGAGLVTGSDSPVRPSRQALVFKIDRLPGNLRLRDFDNQNCLVSGLCHGDARPDSTVETIGTLAGQIGLNFVGIGYPYNLVIREKLIFITKDSQQYITTAQPRFITEGADSFHNGRIDSPAFFGFNGMAFIAGA